MPAPLSAALALGALTALTVLTPAKSPGAAPLLPLESPAAGSTAATESPLRNRLVFTLRMKLVKLGMPRETVRELLGPPDDTWSGDEMDALPRQWAERSKWRGPTAGTAT
jgi:hypothetical protein